MTVTISPIRDDQFDTVLTAFNEGYEGYIVPFHLEAAQLQAHIINGSIDLGASRMAFDGDRVIGIVLLGIRGQRGWIGGVGVNQAWRSRGIGRQLMEAAIASAREGGLTSLQLEVIEGNTTAHNLYLSLGFQDTCRLMILSRVVPSSGQSGERTNIHIESLSPDDALPPITAFHARPNPWQREPESLHPQAARLLAWCARRGSNIAACAIANAGETSIQWMDIGFAPTDIDALRALLLNVHRQYPQGVGRMVNLPEDDPAWPVLSSLGYTEVLAQHEMCLDL